MTDRATITVTKREKMMTCLRCDVTWRSTPEIGCWLCGHHGIPRGDTVVVEPVDD